LILGVWVRGGGDCWDLGVRSGLMPWTALARMVFQCGTAWEWRWDRL